MSQDVFYKFRSNSNFLYFSGHEESNALFVLRKQRDSFTSMLVVPSRDPHSELWEGPRPTTSELKSKFGFDEVLEMHEARTQIPLLAKSADGVLIDDSARIDEAMTEMRNLLASHTLYSAFRSIHNIRIRKSKQELHLLKKAADIAAAGFHKAMVATKPGVNEQELEIDFDFHCRKNGARWLAFVPVVAGGARATIMHYTSNNHTLKDGEIVYIDAGCDYQGYSSDISRAWPVNGRFSPAQREMYEALLSVQVSMIETIRSNNLSFYELGQRAKTEMIAALNNLGIKASHRTLSNYYPHTLGHYLGMDVHDVHTCSDQMPLHDLNGVVFTIEPGLYFPANDSNVPKELRGVGFRIEDDVAISDGKLIVLSEGAIKDPSTIEKLMGSR